MSGGRVQFIQAVRGFVGSACAMSYAALRCCKRTAALLHSETTPAQQQDPGLWRMSHLLVQQEPRLGGGTAQDPSQQLELPCTLQSELLLPVLPVSCVVLPGA